MPSIISLGAVAIVVAAVGIPSARSPGVLRAASIPAWSRVEAWTVAVVASLSVETIPCWTSSMSIAIISIDTVMYASDVLRREHATYGLIPRQKYRLVRAQLGRHEPGGRDRPIVVQI